MPRPSSSVVAALAAVLGSAPVASATWSIVIADSETREVAVGTVTCLNNFDLLAIVPVVVVEKGAAAVQAAGDFQGIRRPVIFDELAAGTSAEEILAIVSQIGGHQSRQYGIVETMGGAVTFTGTQNGAWAGGTTGVQGTMHYAIQGNVLAGPCVVEQIEIAIRAIDGDVAEKLMFGMEVARDAGGDGRCSCATGDPPCDCPVLEFDKSGHIGGMVVARVGDTDDPVCNASGCADGDYFMRLNVAFQSSGRPDPVDQLRGQFDAWRAENQERPDAIRSTATFDPAFIPPNGVTTTTMTITLRDWRGFQIDGSIELLTVAHAATSDGRSGIGPVVDNGDGTFDVVLTAGTEPGVDRFAVVADDGIRPVTLMPEPRLEYFSGGDANGDGAVDFRDLLAILKGWGPCAGPPEPCPADLNGDGTVNFADILLVLSSWST